MMRMTLSLNVKEQAVYEALPAYKDEVPWISIEDLASKAFAGQKRGTSSGTRGNSWVRNSLRKPLRLGLIKQQGRKSGMYARTEVTLKDLLIKQATEKAEGNA